MRSSGNGPSVTRGIANRVSGRGTARDFVLLIQHEHKKLMHQTKSNFLKGEWNEHFSAVSSLY